MSEYLQEPKKVKIRKNHICQGCGKTLNTGANVTVTKCADGGTAYSFYECEECRSWVEEKCYKCNDFVYCIGENYRIGSIANCKNESEK